LEFHDHDGVVCPAARGEPDALVFVNDDGSKIDASNLMARVLKPTAVRAGVGEWVETPKGKRAETWVGFHSFRHTCATLAIREAVWSLEQVQVFLGHSSRMTTDRYYAHLVSTDAPAPPPVRRSLSRSSPPLNDVIGFTGLARDAAESPR
jgi:integrase